jgi:uncharacterized protein
MLAALMVLALALGASSEEKKVANPVGYFEVPVNDLDRAVTFYERVFEVSLQRETVDGYAMALFPAREGAAGASGALAKGDVYVPGKAGPILYFTVASIDATLQRAQAAGARILYPKKAVGTLGSVAEIEDSEGNRIALFEAAR